jgi:hypothetical protein
VGRTKVCAGFVALGSLLLSACGSGGAATFSGGSDTVSMVVPSVPAEDGVVQSDQTVRTDGAFPQTGDLGMPGSSQVCRQFFSFDLSAVPPGSLVSSAVVRLDAFVVVGAPFTTLGSVLVDHLDYGTLDFGDFGARALTEGLGPIASGPSLGAKTLDVTSAVGLDVARGRTRSQFRLRFSPVESDNDTQNDFVSFAEAEAAVTGNGQPPALALVLRVPR